MPSSLKSVGTFAFLDCTFLKEVNLPEGVERIEEFTFDSCDLLQKIVIPESVVYIGENNFELRKNAVIYGAEGSYAQQYAEKYGISFADIEENPENPT